MKKIILHIGQPKTGSSSLQWFFYFNKELLNKENIAYYIPLANYVPWKTKSNGHFLLVEALNRLKDPVDKEKKKFLSDNPSLDIVRLRLSKKLVDSLVKEKENFINHIKNYDTVILSEEVIWHYCIFYENFWETIKEYLDECVDEEYETFVVVYQRRQDQWILSKWLEDVQNQIPIKLGFNKTVEEYERIGYFDYYSILKGIEKVFGKDYTIVRNFNRKNLYDHNIINDFCHVFNLGVDLKNSNTYKTNQSRSIRSAYALNLINKGVVKSKYNNEKDRFLLYQARHSFNKIFKYEKPNSQIMTKKEREDLLNRLMESNENLAVYNNGKSLFDYEVIDGPIIKENIFIDKMNAHILNLLATIRVCYNKTMGFINKINSKK